MMMDQSIASRFNLGARLFRKGRRRFLRLSFVAFSGFFLFQLLTWPRVARLAKENPSTTAFISRYEKQVSKGTAKDPLRWRWVPYGSISDELKLAVLVTEDIDFFDHGGFATAEIEKAIKETLEEGKPLRGASTLTQQLAKNLWLSPSRNPWRKVKEALLTLQLEYRLEKRRILEIYLNVAEFGPGIYGAEAASRHYFGISASALSPRQSAELAAALASPSRWHPGGPGKGRERRVQMIEGRVARARGWLSKSI
ncbi:MAG: monofunctional biosynthetic peptidoglycan transglycosylase [Acidobacteria bacterium]|nr:monofunctional biosynthetic peptidoglycan transglycosylase [Acidobacteriota bacterium]